MDTLPNGWKFSGEIRKPQEGEFFLYSGMIFLCNNAVEQQHLREKQLPILKQSEREAIRVLVDGEADHVTFLSTDIKTKLELDIGKIIRYNQNGLLKQKEIIGITMHKDKPKTYYLADVGYLRSLTEV